jgi:hypothetical protein
MSAEETGAAGEPGLAAPGRDAAQQQKDDEQQSRWQRLLGSQWTVTLAGGLIVTVIGGLLVYFLTLTHKPSTPVPAAPVIPTGYYVSGSPGTPHYFMLVSSSHGDSISGTLAFVGQDGQTGFTQTFLGTLSDGTATLNFSQAGTRTAQVEAQSRPPTISLGACTAYLQFATSLTECSFRHASDIQGD